MYISGHGLDKTGSCRREREKMMNSVEIKTALLDEKERYTIIRGRRKPKCSTRGIMFGGIANSDET